MIRDRQTRSGFTLVEVVVALAATAILLSIILNGATLAKERSAKATQRAAAIQLAGTLYAERQAMVFGGGSLDGERAGLHWHLEEREVTHDPRGFFMLSALIIKISDAKGKSLYTLEGRALKAAARS